MTSLIEDHSSGEVNTASLFVVVIVKIPPYISTTILAKTVTSHIPKARPLNHVNFNT